MQVKKFEAPTMQEALDNVKKELGPEAIILQTKKAKRGFGIMAKAYVEITAAVSDRSLQKKQIIETKLPEPTVSAVKRLPAEKQANVYNKYADRYLDNIQKTQDKVELSQPGKRITATRYADIIDDEVPQTVAPKASKPVSQPAVKTTPAAPSPTDRILHEEVRSLKAMIEELKADQRKAQDEERGAASVIYQQMAIDNPALQDAFEQLVMNGVDRRFGHALIKKVIFEIGAEKAKNPEAVLDALAVEIMNSVPTASLLDDVLANPSPNGPTCIALIGPTGVGKTTTLAKLAKAAQYKKNLKIGFIDLDHSKKGSFDQLATFAKILGIPFRAAKSADDLNAAMMDFQSLDLVLIDTVGHSPKNPVALKEAESILRQISDLKTCLLASATTRDIDLYDIVNKFSVFSLDGIVITKLDEATVFGGIYNISKKTGLPLLYFTTGQNVPDDMEPATRERLVALIMDL